MMTTKIITKNTEPTKPKKRKYRKRKSAIPQMHDKNRLVEALIDSLIKITGYTKKELYEDGSHDMSFWRRLAVYVLVTEFGWTQRSAGIAFGLSSPAVSLALDKFEQIVESEDRKHELLPYLEKIVDYIVL